MKRKHVGTMHILLCRSCIELYALTLPVARSRVIITLGRLHCFVIGLAGPPYMYFPSFPRCCPGTSLFGWAPHADIHDFLLHSRNIDTKYE
jgi:hypothetical protein